MLTTVSDCSPVRGSHHFVSAVSKADMCTHVHSSYLYCEMTTITKQYMCKKFCVKYGKMVMETYKTFKSAFTEETVCYFSTF
jgi:hypothetical protein